MWRIARHAEGGPGERQRVAIWRSVLVGTVWLGAVLVGPAGVAYAEGWSVADSRDPLVAAAQDFERVETAVSARALGHDLPVLRGPERCAGVG